MSRHLVEHLDPALELGLPQVGHGPEAAGHRLLVPGQAAEDALPRQRVRPSRVEVDVLQRRQQVLRVGNRGLVELLGVAHPHHAPGHPVGEHDDVLADVLAVGELALDLAVVGVVAVDVLAVGDVDARLLLELLQRRVGLGRLVVVEVQRPVGPGDGLLGRRDVLGRRRTGGGGRRARGRPGRGAGAPGTGGAARREQGRGAEAARAAEQGTPGDPAAVVQGDQLPHLGGKRRARAGSASGHGSRPPRDNGRCVRGTTPSPVRFGADGIGGAAAVVRFGGPTFPLLMSPPDGLPDPKQRKAENDEIRGRSLAGR